VVEAVLDASAILALLQDEPGSGAVEEVLGDSIVSAVNHSEIIGKLMEKQPSESAVESLLSFLVYVVVDFDTELAWRTGLLRPATRAFGLSLGDRACLALGQREQLPVFTADRRWAELDVGVDIKLIR